MNGWTGLLTPEPAKNGGQPGYKLLIFDILTLFQNSVYSGRRGTKTVLDEKKLYNPGG